MLRKFAMWFICFGLSYFVANVLGWTGQGEAFLYIYLGASVLIGIILILILLVWGGLERELPLVGGVSVLLVFAYVVAIAIALFATWGATQLFDVDFYVAYQIMTFGQCLVSNNTKSEPKVTRTYYV